MAAMLGSDLKSRMAREVRQLAQTPPEGVKYVETDADALTEVHADLTGPEGTPYAGAVFRLKLVIGTEFPSAPVSTYFTPSGGVWASWRTSRAIRDLRSLPSIAAMVALARFSAVAVGNGAAVSRAAGEQGAVG